jgi:hypothetical protein
MGVSFHFRSFSRKKFIAILNSLAKPSRGNLRLEKNLQQLHGPVDVHHGHE